MGNKLRMYREFKTKFGLENYLMDIKNINCRKLVTKLRISDHHLQIELGRRSKPRIPPDSRFCKFCVTSVEDEFHYLMKCPKYSSDREVLFSAMKVYYPIFDSLNEREKFLYILSSDDTLSLMKYIRNTMFPPAAKGTDINKSVLCNV